MLRRPASAWSARMVILATPTGPSEPAPAPKRWGSGGGGAGLGAEPLADLVGLRRAERGVAHLGGEFGLAQLMVAAQHHQHRLAAGHQRSEEHTSELQSLRHLVC